jgi:hypothetical protein
VNKSPAKIIVSNRMLAPSSKVELVVRRPHHKAQKSKIANSVR